MKLYYRSFVYYFFVVLSLEQTAWASAQEDSPVRITVHNVGQGNCVTLRAYDEFMIIDAGSSAYTKELKYTNEQLDISTFNVPLPQSPVAKDASIIDTSPLMSPIRSIEQSKDSMRSDIYSPDFYSTVNRSQQEWLGEDDDDKDNEIIDALPTSANLINNIMNTLRTRNNQLSLHVKTAVVTHPDSDHYNLLENLIGEDDALEYLVLVGLPNLYLKSYTPLNEAQKSTKDFNRWVIKRIKKGTKLYFPTLNVDNQMNRAKIKLTEKGVITAQDIIDSTGEIDKQKIESVWNALLNLLPDKESYSYAPNITSFASQPYENAFAFKNVTITPLALNPVHHEIQSINKQHSTILRTILPDDTNSDSLVLKISYGASSIILPGDATSLTTERIEANYKGSLDFLKATVLLASHHGAESDGSNNVSWIGLTQPEYVLISNGHSYGHPRKAAYGAFKTSPNLKAVDKRHKVLVGDNPRAKGKDEVMDADLDEEEEEDKNKKEEEDKNKEKNTGELHATNRAIFSTLNSGTLAVALFQDGNVKLRTEIDGNIIASNKQDENKEEEQSVDDTVEEVEIKTTPQKIILKKKRNRIGLRELKGLNIDLYKN